MKFVPLKMPNLPANGGPVKAATPPLNVRIPNADVSKSSLKSLKLSLCFTESSNFVEYPVLIYKYHR